MKKIFLFFVFIVLLVFPLSIKPVNAQESLAATCKKSPTLSLVGKPVENANNVVYNLKIKNNDSTGTGCLALATRDYKISRTLPGTNWTGQFRNLVNGEIRDVPLQKTKQFSLTVTPPSGAAAREYSVKVKAVASLNNKLTDTLGLKYVVTNPGGGNNCTKHPPKLEITPSNRNGNPGDEKTYDIKVTNKDRGAGCDPVTFVLSKEHLPSDRWTGRFDDNTLNNIPKAGGSKSTKFHVRSPANATNGVKPITLGVRRQSQAQAQVRTNITYTVESSTSPSPTGRPSSTPSRTPTPTPNPTVCDRNTPEVTITQDKTFVKPGGGKITYTIKIKNIDEGPCPERSMNLTRTLHNDNWKGVWDPNNSFKFNKGETRTKKLAVTSPEGAPKGTYKVKINLRNNADEVVLTKEAGFIISNTEPSPSPSPSPSPTGTPTPSPTGGPPRASLFITIGADGLGTTKRIPLGGNKNPDPDFTNLDVFLYKASDNTRAFEVNTTFTYDPDPKKEKLVGTVSLPPTFPSGIYNLYVIGPQYKLAQLPGSITLDGGDKTIENDNFNLIVGDINKVAESNNNIDQNDYNVLLSCSIYSQDSETCDKDSNYKEYSDLNYDGIVNEDDFTLWLKEVANQEGAQFPDQ